MKYLALLLFYISQINSDIYFIEENKILDERCKLIRTVEYQEKYWTAKRKDEYYETRCKEDEYCFDVNSRYRKNYQGEIYYLYYCLKKHRLLDTGEKCIKNIYPNGLYPEVDSCLEGSCINNICQKNIDCVDGYCGSKQRCDYSSNKCVKLKGENESCYDSSECDIGLICADRGNTFKEIKTCIKIDSLGGKEICKDEDACKSGEVYAQKCVEPDVKNNIDHRFFANYLEKFYKYLEEAKNNKRYAPAGYLRYTLNNKEVADQFLIYRFKNILLEHKIIDEKGIIDEKVRWKINCLYSDYASNYLIPTDPYEEEKEQNKATNEEMVKEEEIKEKEKLEEKDKGKEKESQDSEESKKENEKSNDSSGNSLDNGKKGSDEFEIENDKLDNKTKKTEINENKSNSNNQKNNNSKNHLNKIILFIIILLY